MRDGVRNGSEEWDEGGGEGWHEGERQSER